MSRKIKKNRIEIDGKIALVYPNGQDNKIPFIFDAEDMDLLKYYTIHADQRGGYPITTIQKSKGSKDILTVKIHRLITGSLCHEYPVDHINGNIKDNRKSNLRVCYLDDASNQANRPKNWFNHEMVNVKNRNDGYFQLTLSNGIYEDIEILYKKYSHLLSDYYFLHDNGLDEGIPILLSSNYKYYKKLEEQTQKGTEEYIQCLNSLQYIKEKLKQKQQKEQYIKQIRQEFEAEGKEFTSGFYQNKDGKVFVLFTEPKKSKDINESDGEDVIFRYVDNYQK